MAIIARLKPGTAIRAAELIEEGPPFDPEESGFERHRVYLSGSEVVFVFEAHEVEWLVDSLANKFEHPFRWTVSEAFAKWRPLIEGSPRIAREQFSWVRQPAVAGRP